MQSPKPTLVLIPTAWHSPVHYVALSNLLTDAGYPVSSQALPSVDPHLALNVHVATDEAFIRETLLLPLLEGGKDVVLVMHGYGASPGAAAAVGLSKKERANQDRKGGVIGLVVVAGFVFAEGETLFSRLGGKFEPWHVVNVRISSLLVSVLRPYSTLMTCSWQCRRQRGC